MLLTRPTLKTKGNASDSSQIVFYVKSCVNLVLFVSDATEFKFFNVFEIFELLFVFCDEGSNYSTLCEQEKSVTELLLKN